MRSANATSVPCSSHPLLSYLISGGGLKQRDRFPEECFDLALTSVTELLQPSGNGAGWTGGLGQHEGDDVTGFEG